MMRVATKGLRMIFMPLVPIFFTLGLSSCGDLDFCDHVHKTSRPDDYNTDINPDFDEYYESFGKLHGGVKPTVPIRYGDLKDPVVGLCEWGEDWNRITIDKVYWDSISEYSKESLVFHELGHCALGRSHDEKKIHSDDFGDIPESIMWYQVIGGQPYYPRFRDYYLRELFNP